MEFEQILKIIDHVSDSNLTSFQYENGSVKISMKCGKKTKIIARNVDMSLPDEKLPAAKEHAQAEGKLVNSPLVGTFYTAPSEDAKPFVSVGDPVKKGQVLAIVEAMKLMNEIESDFEGRIAEIYVKNGQAVEYGQALFRIE